MSSPEEMHAERLAVFNHATEELRFFKTQHWTAVTYSVALLGGMLALGKAEPTVGREIAILSVFLVIGYAFVFASLIDAERKERLRLDEARKCLPELWRLHGEEVVANAFGRNAVSIAIAVVPGLASWIVVRTLW
jgi:hypothetical protein